MTLPRHISIFFMLMSSVLVTAQVTFEAKVSKTKLGVNERLRIDFEMNQDGDNFSPPDFSNFVVVGGPNQSVSNSWYNGVRSFSKTYSYFLSPKSQGSFSIGQASIDINGETYKTKPVTVEVTSAVQRLNDPDNAVAVADDNIHLVAEISNTNPYLNEAITVVYKLYVGRTTGVNNWREVDNPRYNDFWSQNLDNQGQKVQNTTLNGKDYRYLILRKTVLYPQKTGKLEIEPLTLDLTVEVPTSRRNYFGQQIFTNVQKTVSAGSKSINVKPLPEKGKPANFTGAVGDFNFKITTSKTDLNATESFQAQVEVSGNGNLKLFQLPKLTLPSSLEVYEPEHHEDVKTTLSGMQGKISDSYTIVPEFRGKYPIPSVNFSYFDLRTETYKTMSSGEIIINVLEGPTNTSNSDNNFVSGGSGKQAVTLNSDQFAFIKTDANLISIEKKDFFKSKWFWTSLLAPFLAIPLALVFKRKKDERAMDVQGNKIRRQNKLAKKFLGEAKKAMGNKEAFYIALEKALHNYLKANLHIETSEFSKDRIQTLLLERGVEQETVTEFIKILNNCELARYTPLSTVAMQQDYERAARTISIIDKQLR